jgi:phytoene dehydrogenase-like protein
MGKSAIIVGGGHNGLVCACYLARAGWQVTVLERRSIVGGAAVTETFHPGFKNSTASYTVSLLDPQVIKDLHLREHGLKMVTRPCNNLLPLPNGDFLALNADANFNREQISKFSSHDAAQLANYNNDIGAIAPIVKSLMASIPPKVINGGLNDIFASIAVARKFIQLEARHKRLIMKLFTVSAAEFLDYYFESDPLKAVFGFDAIVGHFDSPYSPGSAYVLLHHLLGEVNGEVGAWGHAIGGMGAITTAMAEEATSLGVKIQLESGVASLKTKANRVTELITQNDMTLSADLIVANVNPRMLFLDLLPADSVPADIREHFEGYKCQSGTFRMNVALDELPQFTCKPTQAMLAAGIIMAPTLDYMDRAYRDAKQTGWSKQPIVEMLIPSLLDPNLAPQGKHVASLFCQQFDPKLRSEWDTHRQSAIDAILNTVESFAPGFKSLIVGQQAHSPWDLEQKFGLVGGDIFHGRLSLEQLFSARPMLGMGQYRTHLDNLYMCGAGTHPGGGVSGLPGQNAARAIIGGRAFAKLQVS